MLTEQGKGLSKEKMAEIQSQIEADRRRLESQKDMAEEEKRKVEEDLAKKESELSEAQLVFKFVRDNNWIAC